MNAEQLARMNLRELRSLAAVKGVAGAAKLRKEELVEALVARLEPAGATPPATPAPTLQPLPAPGGSSHRESAPVVHHHAPDGGLPVPEQYGRDRLVLMVQDPHHVFAYWEVTQASLARAWAEAGDGACPVLLLSSGGPAESREVDLRGGNYYLTVAPRTTYTAVLALRACDGRLIELARSNPATTPAAAPSTRADEDWMAVDESMDASIVGNLLAGSSGSGQRFQNARRLHVQRLAAAAPEGAPAPDLAAGAGADLPSSHSLPRPESLSSHVFAPSSHVLWSSAALSSGALAQGPSSGALQSSGSFSSHLLSSRALSSLALSSGAVVRQEQAETVMVGGLYPAPVSTFDAAPSGLPKAAEGAPVASAPPPAATTQPAQPAPAPAPQSAPASDPLAFAGAPKSDQRKPVPRR